MTTDSVTQARPSDPCTFFTTSQQFDPSCSHSSIYGTPTGAFEKPKSGSAGILSLSQCLLPARSMAGLTRSQSLLETKITTRITCNNFTCAYICHLRLIGQWHQEFLTLLDSWQRRLAPTHSGGDMVSLVKPTGGSNAAGVGAKSVRPAARLFHPSPYLTLLGHSLRKTAICSHCHTVMYPGCSENHNVRMVPATSK